ncbi:MAG: autotransporter-associated beta strand repeat-containing protein [Chthoniobacterales bacterium]|nr:autotransporter-associated beta strand repeat-containing protein [Chthoniobacterales bacterium]
MAATDVAGGQGAITLVNTATAGSLAMFTHRANPIVGKDSGVTAFVDDASAGSATFINEAAVISGGTSGVTNFFSKTTAAQGVFINDGSAVNGAIGGSTSFLLNSRAASAILIANGGSNGGDGGRIAFFDTATGDTARVELVGNGLLDLTVRKSKVLTLGSIEGDGLINLGSVNLVVGGSNLTTTFSGVILEGQSGSGSLTKSGTGTLVLSGASIYTGATIVSAGALQVANKTGSATGTGAVKVSAGILGGNGIIAGPVTVGTGSGAGAFLTPGQGARRPAALTIQSALTFKADATYVCTLNSKKAKADQVVANGITIESGAQFSLNTVANKKLTPGQIFSAISNTSAGPISGTFANLPDGSTFTAGRNSFQVSYKSGDGNDLTLTVVP